MITISTQLILSALGAAFGATVVADSGTSRTDAPEVATAVGIWSIISLLIALCIGGWVMARTCGPMKRSTALLNGAILWATTLALSSWLLATGVSGALGVVDGANLFYAASHLSIEIDYVKLLHYLTA